MPWGPLSTQACHLKPLLEPVSPWLTSNLSSLPQVFPGTGATASLLKAFRPTVAGGSVILGRSGAEGGRDGESWGSRRGEGEKRERQPS